VAIAPVVAPPPPPAIVIDAAPAAPRRVMSTIKGAPDGAEILENGIQLGAAPGPIQLDRSTEPVVLTFRADGYGLASRPVVPDTDKTVDVKLKPKPRPVQQHQSRDDIIQSVDFDQKAK
jgi:hypothetical protein